MSNVVGLEDYVQGVIVREMSSSWPLEALKTQAVCARTYAYRNYTAGETQGQGLRFVQLHLLSGLLRNGRGDLLQQQGSG